MDIEANPEQFQSSPSPSNYTDISVSRSSTPYHRIISLLWTIVELLHIYTGSL